MTEACGFPNQATPTGSAIYYGIRFSPRERHSELAVLYACCEALRVIPLECSEPQVARTKLAWWNEEFDRASAGRPRHPLTRCLVSLAPALDIRWDLFEKLGEGVSRDVDRFRYGSWDDLMDHCLSDTGIPMELLARCNGLGDDEILEPVRRLGAFVRIARLIQNLGGDLRNGFCYLPDEILEKFDLEIGNLSQRQRPVALSSLLAELAHRARSIRDQALAELPRERELVPVLALGAIANATLDELVRAEFPVLDRRLSLTPVRKLWIAWSASRRLRF